MGIRDLRKARGMSQQCLSDKSGVPRARISDYETGYVNPHNMTIDTAIKLADAMNITDVRHLLEPGEPPPKRLKKKSRDVD